MQTGDRHPREQGLMDDPVFRVTAEHVDEQHGARGERR
jgi:hypothetical protein